MCNRNCTQLPLNISSLLAAWCTPSPLHHLHHLRHLTTDGLGYADDGEDHLFDDPDAQQALRKRGVHGELSAAELKKAKKRNAAAAAAGKGGGGDDDDFESAEKTLGKGILSYMNKTSVGPDAVARPDKIRKQGEAGATAASKPRASAGASLDLDAMLDGLVAAPKPAPPKKTHGRATAAPAYALRPGAPGAASSSYCGSDEAPWDGGGDDGDGGGDGGGMVDDPADDAGAAAVVPEKRSRFGKAGGAGAGMVKAAEEAAAAAAAKKAAAAAAASQSSGGGGPGERGPRSSEAVSLASDILLDGSSGGAGSLGAPTAQNALDPSLWLGKDPVTGETFLDMFWIDACEQNGVVYLFGKVAVRDPAGAVAAGGASVANGSQEGSASQGASSQRAADDKEVPTVSCCVVVKNLMRSMFVLPRELPGEEDAKTGAPRRVGLGEVHKELTGLLMGACIPKGGGSGFKCKPVKRRYAFEDTTIPRAETEYLKVVYPAVYPAPPLEGYAGGVGSTFSHILGAQTAPLEHFLVKRKLMGPQWVRIKAPKLEGTSASWCKLEVNVDDPKAVGRCEEQPPAPTVSTMTVQMKTVVNPKTHAHEVVAVAAALHRGVQLDRATEESRRDMKWFIAVRPLGTSAGDSAASRLPHDLKQVLGASNMGAVVTLPNERALLSMLLTRIGAEDPDVLVSHNLFGFDFDVLLTRSIEHKLGLWSKLGRLRKSKMPNMKGRAGSNREGLIASAATGRILADTCVLCCVFLPSS